MAIRKPGTEMRAYIHWDNRWRHVYIIAGYDQMNLLGEPVKMIQFRTSKRGKTTYSSEKINFHKTKPAQSTMKKGVAA
jgi:hypothetical protein